MGAITVMKFEDIDLSELPPRLHGKIVKEADVWEKYRPGFTPRSDYPFGRDWWKYVYWIPKIKKEIYQMVITKTNVELEQYFYETLGMDQAWFYRTYRDFHNRLEWMRKNYDYTHLGEL